MMIGVSCPVLLLYIALCQFYTAVCLVRLAREKLPTYENPEERDSWFSGILLGKKRNVSIHVRESQVTFTGHPTNHLSIYITDP